MSLIFYDTETSGLSSAFDQILQFAAIRTDDDLNEIGRFEIRSRLLPYIIPSPQAMTVTGMTIDDLLDATRPSHYEMVCELRRALGAWCPSMFIGHNSLRFDEEMLRQAFYQCLHPPYLTNTGGSKRGDSLPLFKAAAALHPGSVTVPLNDKGKPSFKLDKLAPENGFAHLNAHDALADVEALIFLCRIVKERCPELWSRFVRFARKDEVDGFVKNEAAFLLVEPSAAGAGRVVCAIGEHPDHGNLVYCYDLAADPAVLNGLDDEALAKRVARSPKILRKVKKNAAPMLCPLDEAPAQTLAGIDPELWRARGRDIRADQTLVKRLIAVATAGETGYPPSPYVERQIYDGFWSNADGRLLESFHAASWEDRVAITEKLQDPRLLWLARRLIFVERPELLAPDHHTSMAREKAVRMVSDEPAGWLTIGKAAEALVLLKGHFGIGSWDNFSNYLEVKRADAEQHTQ
jgi:exodeoxyribonuclease-1